MRISKQRLQKIIKEELQHVLNYSTMDPGHMYLFESKSKTRRSKPRRVKFETMLERYDRGLISAKTLVYQWNRSTVYEAARLDARMLEDVDWERRSAEIEAGDVEGGGRYDPEGRPAPGMGAMAQRAGAAVSGAFEKASDWVLMKSIQAYELAKRGIQGAIQGARAIIDKASQFKEDHPIAFKVATTVAIAIAIFGLMAALDSDTAQAAIGAPESAQFGGLSTGSEGEITDTAYEALRGLIDQGTLPAGSDGPFEAVEFRTIAMNIVDKAQAAGETVDFSSLQTEYGKFANEQLGVLNGLVKMARDGDPEAMQWINELIEIGEKVIYKSGTVPTRPIP